MAWSPEQSAGRLEFGLRAMSAVIWTRRLVRRGSLRFADTTLLQNRLPHWEQMGATYFVTFRLAETYFVIKENGRKKAQKA